MKKWHVYSHGRYYGSLTASIEDIEAEFGREHKDWYRRHNEVLVLRTPKRGK